MRVKSRENTWIKLEEDRGRACYTILRPQEGVGTAGKSVMTPFGREELLPGVLEWVACSLEAKKGWGRGKPHSLTS